MKEKPVLDIVEEMRALPTARIKVAVSDVDGILRGKYIHKDKFLAVVQSGFGFCNVVFGWDANDSPYDNAAYTGWHTGFPDALARIDLDTRRHIPWDDNTPFFLADFVDSDGKHLAVCPRQVLKRVLAKAERMGIKPMCGFEFEWFNFRETPQSLAAKRYTAPEPITPGMFGYSLIRANQNQPFFKALMEELPAFNVPLEGLHTETGPGVFEAAIRYSDALEAADRAILFKTATKEIGQRFGIMPSFMAKWSMQYPGCGGHLHQSLSDGNTNLFYDAKDQYSMSAMLKSYLAGQLSVLPELMPMYAPNVNSYKRLVDGYWAPVKATWGMDNRTAAFRVITGSAESIRLENRCPGADINPYLAAAACIAAGLYGIEQGMPLNDPPIHGGNDNTDHIPRLPRTLEYSTAVFKRSQLARDFFGNGFVDHFATSREWEWRQFQDAVTDWEVRRYLEII